MFHPAQIDVSTVLLQKSEETKKELLSVTIERFLSNQLCIRKTVVRVGIVCQPSLTLDSIGQSERREKASIVGEVRELDYIHAWLLPAGQPSVPRSFLTLPRSLDGVVDQASKILPHTMASFGLVFMKASMRRQNATVFNGLVKASARLSLVRMYCRLKAPLL